MHSSNRPKKRSYIKEEPSRRANTWPTGFSNSSSGTDSDGQLDPRLLAFSSEEICKAKRRHLYLSAYLAITPMAFRRKVGRFALYEATSVEKCNFIAEALHVALPTDAELAKMPLLSHV